MAGEVERAVRAALLGSTREALAIARHLSAGPYKAPLLGRMGNPDARRHRRATLPPERLNLQSGLLFRSWEVTVSGNALVVANDAPHMEFMAGTRAMFARPIAEAIERELGPKVAARLLRELERELGR